jgi:predicted NAD-dependent protein-ADP-ribosyltransferase YbiA (DUF1768 family)
MQTCPLFFCAKTVPTLKIFSNFHEVDVTVDWPKDIEDVPPFLRGLRRTYPSSEHAYQCLKSLDLETADEFACGGIWSSYTIFEKWPSKAGKKFSDTAAAKQKYWSNAIGIVAKMVSKLDSKTIAKVWKLRFEQKRLNTEVWKPILGAKFAKDSELGKALIKTAPHPLAEMDRRSTLERPSFWGCNYLVKEGMVGANVMGQLLMEQRDRLLA